MNILLDLLGEDMYRDLLTQLNACKNNKDLSDLRHDYYGKNGSIAHALKAKKFNVSNKTKVKAAFNQIINQQEELINNQNDLSYEIATTKPNPHILQQYIRYLKSFLQSKGFKYIEGNLLVTEWENFDSLGIQKNHPSRNEEQTFYLDNDYLLRTQTSAIQRYAIKNKINKCFTIGPVFRRDQDATHTPMFHQMEVISLGKECNLKNLFSFLQKLLSELLAAQTVRFRPSYFPFTSPSYEVDIKYKDKWLEILGCGVIASVVFDNADCDPKSIGWAIGAGIERLVMLKYGIQDIRSLYV